VQRNINPLMPIYSWKYLINNMRYNVGPIDGNTSNPFSLYKYVNPFNLRNDDIEGASPGSKNIYKKFKGSNSCLNIGDIHGAIHGSLLKGISTKRIVNPVAPQYKYPGEIKLKNSVNSIKYSLNNSVNNNSQIKKNDSNNNFKEKNKTIDLIKSKDNNLKISHNNNFNISDYIIKKEDDKYINNKNTNVNEDNNKFEDNPQIKKLLSKINESSTIDNEIKFDKNAYKKPEKYYPIKHDKFLNPHINNYNKIISSKNPKLRSYQQVINEKIKITNYNNNPQLTKNTIISKNPKKSYENKLDDFFVNSTINNYKLQQKLNNNINAFYDIGFPEELKAGDFDPKF
jgi:hypothetical protein